jgi:MFS family permease
VIEQLSARWKGIRAASPFRRLVFVQAFHSAGDALFAVSLAGSLFFAVSLDAARPRLVLYLLLTMAPFALVAPLLGPLSDRLRGGHRAALLLTCAGSAVLCWLLVDDLRNLLVYPEAFGVLVFGKAYSVSKNAVVPVLIDDRERLVRANARLTLTSLAAGSIGGALGAAIVAGMGAPWALRVAALVFAIAGALALSVPPVRPREETSPVLEYESIHTPSVQLAASGMALLRGSVGFVLFLIGFALRRQGEPAWVYGIVFAASGVGALAGSVAAPRLRRRLDEEQMMIVSLALPGVLAVGAAIWFGPTALLVVPLSLAAGASIARQAFDALVQQHAPSTSRGREFARFESLFQMAWVLGALLPVVSGTAARLGFALLAMALVTATVVHGLLRRSALRVDAGLQALRSRILVDVPLEEPGRPEDHEVVRLLADAQSLVTSAPRWAALLAASALDVALARAGPTPWPPTATTEDAVLTDWRTVQQIRSSAAEGSDMTEANAIDAISSSRRVIDWLRTERAG